MINTTEIAQQLLNTTQEEGLRIIGEVYFLPSIITVILTLFLMIFIAIFILKRGWDKFFAIFIIPLLIFTLFIIFTYIFPTLPKLLYEFSKGLLT